MRLADGHYDLKLRKVRFPHLCPDLRTCAIAAWIRRPQGLAGLVEEDATARGLTAGDKMSPETERGRV